MAERAGVTDRPPSSAQREMATRRRGERGARRRGQPNLLSWRVQVPLLALVAALALLLAWQVRRNFALDLGGPDDAPYLAGFHAGEVAADTGITYRWTRDRATIAVPGYGATAATLTLRLQGVRPADLPPPTITLSIGRATPVTLPLNADLRDYELPVAPDAFRDGELLVTLDSPTFRPTGDARDLGIVVDRAALRDNGAPGGLILPPLSVLLLTIVAGLIAYALVAILLATPLGGALAGWATTALFVALALGPRSMLTLYARDLLGVVIFTGAATALAALALRRLRQRAAWATSERALGGAVLLAGVNLLALLAGMRHPQYRSSDLQLNVHRLEFVQRGEWVFTLALPGARALEAPYPPLFYGLMLPFSALIGDKALLVEGTAALGIAAGALLTFALARRVARDDGAALFAAAVYAVIPITYGMVSAGNFANLFGQAAANLYLVALLLTWGRWTRPVAATILTAALTLAFLGHFGVFLSLLLTVPLLALTAALGRAGDRRQGLALLASFTAALFASWVIYYRFHDALLAGYVRDFLGGNTNARGGDAAQSTLLERLRNESRGLITWWGWPALPLGLAGINLLRRVRPSATLTLALTWLGTILPFFLGALVASLSVRYHLFVGPALAVCCGWALWQLWRAHRFAGPAASLLVLAFWTWQTLADWIGRVLHAYH